MAKPFGRNEFQMSYAFMIQNEVMNILLNPFGSTLMDNLVTTNKLRHFLSCTPLCIYLLLLKLKTVSYQLETL